MQKKRNEKKRLNALVLHDHLPTEGPGRDDLMRLYAWAFEDAMKAQDEWGIRHGQDVQGRGPLFRWMGAVELRELYNIYRMGNKAAIMEALFICSLNSLTIPRWCEVAYLAAYRKIQQYRARSWDDVFGRPHQKGVHLIGKQLKREQSLLVYRRIKDVNKNNLFGKREKEFIDGSPIRDKNGRIKHYNPSAIGEKLFERVGMEFNMHKTLAEKFYYDWKKCLEKKT